ncbi:hypothetical protein FRC12_007864 [Ceratobasidium sp. 428]|nr:hypothetical protein FRC12_007864 [Ceratobasidium sp. 428]
MSREDAYERFELGASSLLNAKLKTNSSDCENLLVESLQYLEHAVDLLEEDDLDYRKFVQFCASAHARCLLLVEYSVDIDAYLSSSPLFEILANQDDHSIDPGINEITLRDFWRNLNQTRERHFSATNSELFSARTFANHIVSFNQAISCSSENEYLECLWYTYRAIVLYLRME